MLILVYETNKIFEEVKQIQARIYNRRASSCDCCHWNIGIDYHSVV